MNWGGGGGGTGGGGVNPPPDFGGGSPPPDFGYGTEEPDIPYLERIRVILNQANKVMPFGTRRAALRNRRDVLLEAAKAIQQGQLYNEVGPALYGIFMFANQFKKKSQAERIGTYLGRELSDANDAAVKVQVFQSSLLTTVEETLKEKSITPTLTEQQQVTMAVMQLAETYARFDPTKEASANGVIPNLLNLLWRAQYDKQADLLDDAVLGLKDLLLNVDLPMQAIQFLSNLLKVADTVVGLGDDLKDPAFLKKLVEFGDKYAKLNPDTSLSAQPQGFLDELWRASLDDAEALKRAGAGLSDFFEGATTREQLIKRLEFGGNLLDAAKLAPSTQEQVQDPRFVDALLGLGSAYASLNPIATGAIGQDLRFFLDTLWQTQNVQKGITELESFFKNFSTSNQRLEVLRFQRELLTTSSLLESFLQGDAKEQLRGKLDSSLFLNKFANLGLAFASHKLELEEVLISPEDLTPAIFDFNSAIESRIAEYAFLSNIWNVDKPKSLTTVANDFKPLMELFFTGLNTGYPVSYTRANPQPGDPGPGGGVWVEVRRSGSRQSRDYQRRIAGTTHWASRDPYMLEYSLNSVDFDGVKDGVLVEAKNEYDQFVDPDTGEFRDWFTGAARLVIEGHRQQAAKGNLPLDWYFSGVLALGAVRTLFAVSGINGIRDYIWAP